MDASAQIIGKVVIGPRVFVAPGAIIRADEPDQDGRVHPVEISEECNIHDGVIIHAPAGAKVQIGPRTSLAHGALVHGPAQIDADCFVGIRAMVIAATLEESVWVGVGATILDITIPSHSFVPGRSLINTTDKVANLRAATDEDDEFQRRQVAINQTLRQGYLKLTS
ncbi:MAG: hexapeptide transferase [Desulfarculus sp.]|nr:hexapeptide transferase [Desulfarculus sp.]